MKKLSPWLLVLSLCAADSWQSKPFTAWTDKDVQKILSNSPWAKVVNVSAGGLMDSAFMPGRGRGLGGDDAPPRPGVSDQMPGASPDAPGGNMPSRSLGEEPMAAPSIPLTVVWESALPVKQALARRKYGAEFGSSQEAKNFLDEKPGYMVAVSGIPEAIARASAAHGKAALLERASLAVKGRPPLHASGVEAGPPGKTMEMIFVFPVIPPLSIDDKDVEFSAQFGALAVKYKFHLKDMFYQGALQL